MSHNTQHEAGFHAPTLLWLDTHAVSIKVAEALSQSSGPRFYTWNPNENFNHLVDTLMFTGVILHDSNLGIQSWQHWMQNGLAELLKSNTSLPLIIWGHKEIWDVNLWQQAGILLDRIYYWKGPINPATFDNDRFVLLNQNKSVQ
jgi:hypothetical protein